MAKYFLEAGDSVIYANNPNDSVFITPEYNSSLTRVVINSNAGMNASGVSATLLSNTVFQFPGVSTSYSFTANVNTGMVEIKQGSTTVAIVPVESNSTTAVLSFSNGSAEVTVSDAGGGNFSANLGTLVTDSARLNLAPAAAHAVELIVSGQESLTDSGLALI